MTRHSILLAVSCLLAVLSATWAADKDWNRSANGLWTENINWSPNGMPSPSDDVYFGRSGFPAGFLTTLDASDTVGTLTLLNGSRLTTSTNQLQVNLGLTTIDGLGSALFLPPRTSGDFDSLDSEGVRISNGGTVTLSGGILELESGTIDLGSSGGGNLGGFGTVELVESGLGGASVLNNNGLIYVGRSLFDPLSVTLTLTNFDTAGGLSGTGTVDLDGTTGSGIVDVDDGTSLGSGNLTLVVEAQISDDFDGLMQIGMGDTVDMVNAGNTWGLGGSGVIDMNGASGIATLTGERVILQNGARINANSGIALIENDLNAPTGTLYVGPNSTLHLAGNASVNPSVLDLNGPSSTFQVSGDTSILGIGQDVDWDGQGGGSTTRLSGNGELTINVENIDLNNDSYDGRLELEDNSQLSVTVADGRWDLGLVSSIAKSTPGTATINGSAITSSADITIDAGELVITPNIVFGGAPVISVANAAELTLLGQTGFTESSLDIDGTLQLNGATTWNVGNSVQGSGKIVNEGNSHFTADTQIQVSVFDWDQGTTTVDPGVTTNIDVDRVDTSNDTFNNNTITVNSGTLSVTVADDQWDLGNNGLLRLNQTTGQAPRLSGSHVNVQSGGEIRIDANDSTIDAPLTLQSGASLTVQNPGVVNLDGPTTFAGGDVTAQVGGVTVVQDGNLTVTGNSTVSATTYDWDEGNTTVEANGLLDINVTNIDTVAGQRYDRTLTLNSGSTTVNVAGNVWTMDGTLRLNNNSNDEPVLGGDSVFIGDGLGTADANIRVFGNGTSRIAARTFYNSDADVQIDAGATLEHTSNVSFLGGSTFAGGGAFAFQGNVDVTGPTTIGLESGKLDFTPVTDASGNQVSVDAPLIVDVDTLAAFGHPVSTGINRLEIDGVGGGSLDVSTTPGSWDVNPGGELNLNSDSQARTLITGDDVRMRGEMNVVGDVRLTARQIIHGNVHVMTPNQPLRLDGGSLTRPNRLEGGTISGDGFLAAAAGHALVGHGTIETPINFSGNSMLKADSGTLLISNTLEQAGEVGTATASGVFDVSQPWSTDSASLNLAGGLVTGALISNSGSGSIAGWGSIDAPISNTSSIHADGDPLRLLNTANDFSSSDSHLVAEAGDLEVAALSGTIGGTITVANDRDWFFSGGTPLPFQGTRVELNAGNLRSDAEMAWNNVTAIVSGSTASEISTENMQVFELNSGTIELAADLELMTAGRTTIGSGVAFSGSGALRNRSGSALDLDGADVGVTLVNAGQLEINGSATGRADVDDFIQTATGSFQLDLNGTLLTDFDRMVVSGAVQLDGALEVQMGGGYVPTVGDTFPVVSASSGLMGMFSSAQLPMLSDGLELNLSYTTDQVVLAVVSDTSGGDFNDDGVVGGDDVDDLVAGIVSGDNDPSFDLTGDGMVNADDLDEWLIVAGAANLPSGTAYRYGDASLDGVVDVADFNAWNNTKFTATPAWTMGDFNADGSVDVGDFNIWNNNKFTASDGGSLVPEPSAIRLLLVPTVFAILWNRRRKTFKI